jgi:hypothetical protein
MLLRRVAVESVGGFEEHFSGARQMYEDQGFLSKLYLRWPVYFADEVWLDYRQHPESIMATVHGQGRYDEVRGYYLTWYDSYLADVPDSPPAVRRAVSRALRPYRRPVLDRALRLGARVGARGQRELSRIAGNLRGRAAGSG